MSVISKLITLGAAGASGGSPYWLALYDDKGHGKGDVNTSNGDILVGVTNTNAQSYAFGFILLDKNGAVQASAARNTGRQDTPTGAMFDQSTGKIICYGMTYGDYSAPYHDQIRCHIYNSNGTFSTEFGRYFDAGGTTQTSGVSGTDSSGNIYISSYNASGNYEGQIVSVSQSNSLRFAAGIGSAGGSTAYSRGAAVGGSWAVLGCIPKTTSNKTQAGVFRISTSGGSASSWRTDVAGNVNVNSIAASSTGEPHLVCYNQFNPNASGYDAIVIKLSTSLNVSWMRHFWNTANTGQNFYCENITVDSSGNVYVYGYFTGSGPKLLFKLNSSGTLQWAKEFSAASGAGTFGVTFVSIKAGEDDEVVLTGLGTYDGTAKDCIVLRYPQDGSATGTFDAMEISDFTTLGVATNVLNNTTGGTSTSSTVATTNTTTNLTYSPAQTDFVQL